MLGSFVPQCRKSKWSTSKPSRPLDHVMKVPSKRQKVQHEENAQVLHDPVPLVDNVQEATKPYQVLDNTTSEDINEASSSGFSAIEELLPFTDALLADIPSELDLGNLSFCSSDTDIDEGGDECTSSAVGSELVDEATLLAMLDDKKTVDVGELKWPNSVDQCFSTESYPVRGTDANVGESDLPTTCSPFSLHTHGATNAWTPELLSTVKRIASFPGIDVVVQPDGSITLKPSLWPTPESSDSFLTRGPVGTMVDTGLSEKEFTEGPLRMDAESTFCHVASEGALKPTVLFSEECLEDFDYDFAEPAGDVDRCYEDPKDDCNILRLLFGEEGLAQAEIQEDLKPASDEVTDSELLPICNESDGLSEYGTFQIHGRPVTRMPSLKFAESMPWDLQVVADDISKDVLHADTSLTWLFVLPNRSPKELNRFLPEKTWTNGGKNKDRPTPLNEAMVVQHIGFGAHKLPREKVPSYLHVDREDRAMLRFSMRIYTRRGMKSSKKGYPTAYVVLSLKKPIRRLRHARRS